MLNESGWASVDITPTKNFQSKAKVNIDQTFPSQSFVNF